jgi:hypothetical protein
MDVAAASLPRETAAVESTYRISIGAKGEKVLPEIDTVFHRLAEMLCEECGHGCEEFFLTDDVARYQACRGPKIGWVREGTTVLLRIANCEMLGRTDRVGQLLQHFGLTVSETRVVH